MPVPCLLVLYGACLTLSRPGRPAICCMQDVSINCEGPACLGIDKPDRLDLVFELIRNLFPGLASIGRVQDFETLIRLERIIGGTIGILISRVFPSRPDRILV